MIIIEEYTDDVVKGDFRPKKIIISNKISAPSLRREMMRNNPKRKYRIIEYRNDEPDKTRKACKIIEDF